MAVLSEIMSRDVVTVKPETTLRELVGVLRDARVSGAPVVSGGRVIGVVSATDLLDFEFDAPYEGPEGWEMPEEEDDQPPGYFAYATEGSFDVVERIHGLGRPDWDRLMDHSVAEVMTPAIYSLPPDEDARAAARYMVHQRIHRVLVMEGDDLRGIVSATDILRAVAQGRV